MGNLGIGKVALLVVAIVAAVVVAQAFIGAGGGEQAGTTADPGIDVSNTQCDGLAAARAAVDAELEERVEKADSDYADAMEAASDSYWEEVRNLDSAKTQCETDALLSDPCKALFEKSSRLAQEILDGIDDGFDEAKFDEREQAKKDYDDCVNNPPPEQTYEGMKAACEAAHNAGVAAAQATRDTSEAAAATARDAAKADAEAQHTSKVGILNAIAEECNKPAPVTGISIGSVGTGSTGTVVQSGSPACTGRFVGYDPALAGEIQRLQALYEQARLKDRQGGIGGAGTYAAQLTQLRAEMAAGPRKCTTDAFCGDPEPVCCGEQEVGQVACVGGECSAEKTECESPEFCAGKPAQCVAPLETESQAIEVSGSHLIGSLCISTIRVLDLQQATPESVRFEIVGNIPSWLSFSNVGGALPTSVSVNMDCAALEAMGPGTYTAEGSIVVYDAGGNRINLIPLNVTVTVTAPVVEETSSASVTSPTPFQNDISFAHVKPGEFSEVYVTSVGNTPGASVTAELVGGEVDGSRSQTVTADSSGVAKFTWKIYTYGDYTANINSGDNSASIETKVGDTPPSGNTIEVRGGIFGD